VKLEWQVGSQAGFPIWCGADAHELIYFEGSAILVLDMRSREHAQPQLAAQVPAYVRSFTCAADGRRAYFLSANEKILYLLQLQPLQLTRLVESQQGLFRVNWPHIVSPAGHYVVGADDFPDTIPVPGGPELRVVKGFVPPGVRNKPASIAWSDDERQLFVFGSLPQQLSVYDTFDGKASKFNFPLAGMSSAIHPLGGQATQLLVMSGEGAKDNIYDWRYTPTGQTPQLIVGDTSDDSIHASAGGTLVFSRARYRGNTADTPGESTPLPYATEVDLIRDGKQYTLDTLAAPSTTGDPAITRDGTGVAYIKTIQSGLRRVGDTTNTLVVRLEK